MNSFQETTSTDNGVVDVDTRAMHSRPEPIVIQPGMMATTEIKTGRNSILNFLLKPITRTISESFGERWEEAFPVRFGMAALALQIGGIKSLRCNVIM